MRTPKIIAIMVAGVFFALWAAGSVLAQQTGDKPVSIAGILKAASVPLTDDQAKKLKEFQFTQGGGGFQALATLFDEKQTEALKKALGTRPGRNGGPERPRALMQLVILENAKAPLTQKQVDQIKALAADQSSTQNITELLTDTQKAAMQKAMGQ
ncbi:MAG: hypothetical protein Q8O92_09770 [Candidatus Latescibacter sp.]|nr:hypothetical protein [Candidatus Latescibacter sp.]